MAWGWVSSGWSIYDRNLPLELILEFTLRTLFKICRPVVIPTVIYPSPHWYTQKLPFTWSSTDGFTGRGGDTMDYRLVPLLVWCAPVVILSSAWKIRLTKGFHGSDKKPSPSQIRQVLALTLSLLGPLDNSQTSCQDCWKGIAGFIVCLLELVGVIARVTSLDFAAYFTRRRLGTCV